MRVRTAGSGRQGLRLAAALGFVLALCLILAAPAGAHSLIERSYPAASAALDRPPRQVELWFSEPIDPTFSTATVVDPAGTRVSGSAEVSPDGRAIIVPLQEVPRGFYTVRWRVLSTVDGHTTAGAFAFTVGLGARPPELPGVTAGPDPALAVIRWFGFLAIALLAGAVLFPRLVLVPGLSRIDPIEALRLEDHAAARLRVLTVVSASAVIAAAAVEVVARALVLTGAPLRDVVAGGQLWTMLLTTKPGWAAVVRVAMAALLLLPQEAWGRILRAAGLSWFVLVGAIVVLFGGPAALVGSAHLALVVLVATVYGLVAVMAAIILPQIPDFRIPDLRMASPAAVAVLLLGVTINSHAWGSGPLAVAVDWGHLLATAAWVGGLACLAVILLGAREDRAALARALVPRFSRVAAAGLVFTVATGAYSAWLHMPHFAAFAITEYGRYLGVKLLLVAVLVGLGAVTRFGVRRRLERASSVEEATGPAARFVPLASAEVLLGVGVLFVVALLTATPPARVSLATFAAATPALRLLGESGDARVALAVDPARPGGNRLEVTIAAGDGLPPAEDTRVLVRFIRLDEELAPTTVTLAAAGGRYVADSVVLPPGWWEAEVVLRRRGRLDASTSFPLRLGEAPPARSEPSAVRLLDEAAAAMSALRTWREEEQITDGAEGLVVASLDLARPDRMRVRTSAGVEVVFVGAARYLREADGPWRREPLSSPIAAEGSLQYLRGAEAVTGGRVVPCGDETCRVVLWEAPGRAAAFAGWIGERTRYLHKVLMVAPRHYMTARLGDFDAPLRVDPPRE
jgi:copper transport protein